MFEFAMFVLGLLCGIFGMLGTPKSREQMREHAREIRDAYERGHAAGRQAQLKTGRFSAALRR